MVAGTVGVPALSGLPFLLAGGLKSVFDLLLHRSFTAVRTPGEAGAEKPSA
jgi:hypothetical protein